MWPLVSKVAPGTHYHRPEEKGTVCVSAAGQDVFSCRKLKGNALEACTVSSKRVLHSGFLRRRESEEGGDPISVGT